MTDGENTFFVLDKEIKLELKKIGLRDGKKLKELLNLAAKEYAQAHADGNAQHTITNFQQHEDFVGFPSMAISFKEKKKYTRDVLKNDPSLRQQMKDNINQWRRVIEDE